MAYSFTAGSSQSLNYGDLKAFDGLGKLTIALRLYVVASSNYGHFVGRMQGSTNGFSVLHDAVDGTKLFIGFRNGSSTGSKYTAAGYMSLGAQHAVWVVYDGSQSTPTDRGRAWLDGAEITSWALANDFPATLGAATAGLKFGIDNSGSYPSSSRLSDVGFWLGEAITDPKVIAAYAKGKSADSFKTRRPTYHMPLHKDAVERRIGLVPVVTGALVIPSPKIIWPSRKRRLAKAPAAGGGAVLGIVSETDAALGFGRAKSKALGVVASSEVALPVTAVKSRAVGVAAETDAPIALGRAKAKALGVASEADQSLAIGAAKSRAVARADETDAALGLTIAGGTSIGLVQETATALAIGRAKMRTAFAAGETDTALAMARAKAHGLGRVDEIDAAGAFGRLKARSLGRADELATALAMVAQGGAGNQPAVLVLSQSNAGIAMAAAQADRARLTLTQSQPATLTVN